ncbi:Imm44 family immunity protein [Paracoccus lutimaris]|uniref:Immunity protein 44 of polymorphic toxin system n=1 Tax=Paracoccus lutimaris TaxID=1490030 RepID=A0A368Z3N0_9RHOB|nr:Imm44 family immunity protein [Paracoccus lutimaris]RCW87063.1 immunity protein 44 of polymorphic toxin system [Paracoccus lutimaris]
MEIFFTSFSQGKLGDEAAVLYVQMNRALSERLGAKDFGAGLTSWFLMFILVPPNFPGASDPERALYKKKDKSFDLRLHVPFDAYKAADRDGRRALLYACARRSLDLIAAKKIPDFDIAGLIADVEAIAAAEGWVPGG